MPAADVAELVQRVDASDRDAADHYSSTHTDGEVESVFRGKGFVGVSLTSASSAAAGWKKTERSADGGVV